MKQVFIVFVIVLNLAAGALGYWLAQAHQVPETIYQHCAKAGVYVYPDSRIIDCEVK
jgi:hypothetical protein